MGAETNAFEPRAVPAPFFIFELAARLEPAPLLSTPLGGRRRKATVSAANDGRWPDDVQPEGA
jgi:hypothetical protein